MDEPKSKKRKALGKRSAIALPAIPIDFEDALSRILRAKPPAKSKKSGKKKQ